jgi:hypothetical protein
LIEAQSASEKLTRDVTGVWKNVQHRSRQEQQLWDQLHHAQEDKQKHEKLCQRNSNLLADISTLEQKLSEEKAHGKQTQQKKRRPIKYANHHGK